MKNHKIATAFFALVLVTSAATRAQVQTLTVLHSFSGSPDGTFPFAGLLRDAAGNLYGTTEEGGASGLGTVFKLHTSGNETVIYSFKGGSDGAFPSAGLVMDAAGNLYGTTGSGGSSNCSSGCGTVFKLDPSGNETVLYSFKGGSDGEVPVAGLIRDAAGNLYGTAQDGGSSNCSFGCGTVFKLDPSGNETVLHSFTGSPSDGGRPVAGLIMDTAGNLYGTTAEGGSGTCTVINGVPVSGCGTVFKLDPADNETVLHSFTGGSDGIQALAALIMDQAGNLYGTTELGGSSGSGTVFKLDPSGNETLLHTFTGGNDGAAPLFAGLIMDTAGNLYGTTQNGGGSSNCGVGCGIVFKLDPSGNKTVLHSFTGSPGDGARPAAGLIMDKAGNLYGTTNAGGAYGFGTVFRLAVKPVASVSPSSLTFSSQNVGTTSGSQPVTLKNAGTTTLTISGISLTGTNAGDFSQTHTCGTTLGAGASCTISVTFHPSAIGARSAVVSISDNGGGSPQLVLLSGTGTVVKLAPTSLSFGDQTSGTTSAAKTATLTNAGTTTLTISGISLTGTNAGDFSQTHTCGATLGAGASCTISVTFHPSAIGARSAVVSISDNGGGSPQLVLLSGTGTVVKLAPTSLSFGDQTSGTTSAAKTATLTNAGTTTLTISGISLTGTNAGDFSQTHTCGTTLGAGASCTISVTFHPSAIGARSAAVSISDNGGGSPQLVLLSGTGTVVKLAPTSLSFGDQTSGTTSAAKTATLTNAGTTTLTISGISLTGTNAGDFSQTHTCGTTLGAGASCTISVTFHPSAIGARSAAVSISDNGGGSPQLVLLSGTGTVVKLAPTSLSFGDQTSGTTSAAKTATLTNAGTTTLTISGISLTGTNAGDFSQTHTCGATLGAGASCTISVTFHPSAIGARSAVVSISDNGGGSPQLVLLSGTGTVVKLAPTSLSFGDQTSGTTSAAKTATLTNAGTTTLTISGISLTGTNAGDFSQTHTCGATLGAGASCTISVTFHPSAIGARSAVVSISDNGGGSPQLVLLSGTGTVVKLAPTSLSFGDQTSGTTSAAKTATLTNAGTTTLTISGISLTGTNAGDFSQTHTCGATLGAGASCTISVTFHPSAIGARSAAVSISDNGGGSPQKVPLSGTGT